MQRVQIGELENLRYEHHQSRLERTKSFGISGSLIALIPVMLPIDYPSVIKHLNVIKTTRFCHNAA